MSHGAIPSASREFEGLELDHEGKQISFPGYKVKGGYVSPYSCQALGLKKRSGSQTSLCSSGSVEFDSPVRKSVSKSGSLSGSRGSLLSRSSSKGSVAKGPGTFGSTPRGLTSSNRQGSQSRLDTAVRSSSKTDINRPSSRTDMNRPSSRTDMNRPSSRSSSRSDVSRPGSRTGSTRAAPPADPKKSGIPRAQSYASPRTTKPASLTSPSPIVRGNTTSRLRNSVKGSTPTTGTTTGSSRAPLASTPSATSTPVRQRTGAVTKSDASPRTPISRRTTSNLPTTSTTRSRQSSERRPKKTKDPAKDPEQAASPDPPIEPDAEQ